MSLSLRNYYERVVQPLQWAILDIQRNGILVDHALMKEQYDRAISRQKEIADDLEYALGFAFNPNSTQQVQSVYNSLGLEIGDTGDKLALVKCLKKCADAKGLVEHTIDYRWLGRMKGTYLDIPTDRFGRAHSTFRGYGTKTWRLSSSEINLQNMPRTPKHGINVKNIYVAPTDSVILEFDYAQLEYRIPAYASRCYKLIEIFESGENVHFRNATALFGRSITSKGEEYDFAKRFVYAEGYGSGATNIANHMLADTYVWTEPKVIQELLKIMRQEYPEIYAWHDECWDQIKKASVIYEGFGVPRYCYGHPDDFRGIGYSWPTQATASGIINRALVSIWRDLPDSKFTRFVKMICQVHDSLMFEVKKEVVSDFVPWVKERMEQPHTVFGYEGVKFATEAKVGPRWGSLQTYKEAA